MEKAKLTIDLLLEGPPSYLRAYLAYCERREEGRIRFLVYSPPKRDE